MIFHCALGDCPSLVIQSAIFGLLVAGLVPALGFLGVWFWSRLLHPSGKRAPVISIFGEPYQETTEDQPQRRAA